MGAKSWPVSFVVPWYRSQGGYQTRVSPQQILPTSMIDNQVLKLIIGIQCPIHNAGDNVSAPCKTNFGRRIWSRSCVAERARTAVDAAWTPISGFIIYYFCELLKLKLAHGFFDHYIRYVIGVI